MKIANYHNFELTSKPDFEDCIKRVYAWYEKDIIDRPPVRFSVHNSFVKKNTIQREFKSLKAMWFDAEYQISNFKDSISGLSLKAETFPVYWCNLGPNVYSAYFGCELLYHEETSWPDHCIKDWNQFEKLKFSYDNEYFKKTEELMRVALQMSNKDFMVGYTDLHGGLDCVEGWRNPQDLCFDLYDNEDMVKKAIELADSKFLAVYDHFDEILKDNGQLSIDWMGIPSFGKIHIPSCDFSSMISTEQFKEFCLPSIKMEIAHMTHNIFHLDGENVARHLDEILALPEINAIQWVPTPGNSNGIFGFIDMYKKIQKAGKGLVLDIMPEELDLFMEMINPQGIYLCMNVTAPDAQENILKKLIKWK